MALLSIATQVQRIGGTKAPARCLFNRFHSLCNGLNARRQICGTRAAVDSCAKQNRNIRTQGHRSLALTVLYVDIYIYIYIVYEYIYIYIYILFMYRYRPLCTLSYTYHNLCILRDNLQQTDNGKHRQLWRSLERAKLKTLIKMTSVERKQCMSGSENTILTNTGKK